MNKPAIDWQDEGTRNQLLGELVHDARLLLRLTAGPELSEAETEARGLLVAVTEQDIETPGPGRKRRSFGAPTGSLRLRCGTSMNHMPS